MAIEEIIQVTWRQKKYTQHARIENNYYDIEGDFLDIYVSFSGYFGMHNPNVFAAAPDLYEALAGILDTVSYHDIHPATYDAARAALAKARGE